MTWTLYFLYKLWRHIAHIFMYKVHVIWLVFVLVRVIHFYLRDIFMSYMLTRIRLKIISAVLFNQWSVSQILYFWIFLDGGIVFLNIVKFWRFVTTWRPNILGATTPTPAKSVERSLITKTPTSSINLRIIHQLVENSISTKSP